MSKHNIKKQSRKFIVIIHRHWLWESMMKFGMSMAQHFQL